MAMIDEPVRTNSDDLTVEQQAVVDAGVDERLLVVAGPGTGKTHTLQRRLVKLIESDDVAAGYIIVLSFSRAAVGEVRRRLRASGTDAARVRVATFDSFATNLLANNDPDGTWIEQSFDGRIQAAIAGMDRFNEDLADFEHICIDEVQDLVGVRMRFVRALLERHHGGFSLFGDPAQGIYNFQLSDDETPDSDGSPALFRWLRSAGRDELIEHTLTHNHRAQSERARRAGAVGLMAESDPAGAISEIQDLFDELPRLPSLASLARPWADAARTAVLCRNNGQVLATSRVLHEAGVAHTVQRRATERSVAPWVAGLLRVSHGGLVTRERMEDLLGVVRGPHIDDVWIPLRRAARDGRDVDLDRLRRRIADGSVPDELHEANEADIVVSTVHRAKGLEYDRVVVVDDGWGAPYDDDYLRTLFVALSRAISTLALVDKPDIGGGPMVKEAYRDRWYHRGFKPWQRFGMEMHQDDIEAGRPFGNGADAIVANQEFLSTQVEIGDPVILVFERMRIADPPYPLYRLMHDDRLIGITSEEFGRDLVWILKGGRSSSWTPPPVIGGLVIDAVRTVVGDPAMTNQDGLGTGGAWIVPTVTGLGRFQWKKE